MNDNQLFSAAEQIATFNRRQLQLNRNLPIRSSEMGVLIFIEQQQDTVTATQIGHFLGVAKPSVTVIIKALLARDFITATPLSHDQRQKALALTEKGQLLLQETKSLYFERLNHVKSKLGTDDFNQFIQLLTKINIILETEGI